MFTVALFIVFSNWKQFKGPSVGEWVNQRWYIYATEYYAAIKRNSCYIQLLSKSQKHHAKPYTVSFKELHVQ